MVWLPEDEVFDDVELGLLLSKEKLSAFELDQIMNQ